MSKLGNYTNCSPRRQRGVALILFIIAMVAILATVGLSVDSAHAYLNFTRAQNAVDAAAFGGAKMLDDTDDIVLAEIEARRIFTANLIAPGQGELATARDQGMSVSVQFSATVNPFVPGTTPAKYVRVRVDDFDLPGWFVPVIGVDTKTISTSAVAGPSPNLSRSCSISPFMVCGDTESSQEALWGHNQGEVYVVKTGDEWADQPDWEVGPGNFRLLDWSKMDSTWGDVDNTIRHQAAGADNTCLTEDTDMLETKTGNTDGPVVHGLNTRFGEYIGGMKDYKEEYPPDVIVTQTEPRLTWDQSTQQIIHGSSVVTGTSHPEFYDIEDYQADVGAGNFDYSPGIGAVNRRQIVVPVGDCSETLTGQGSLPMLGFLCFHLLQVPEQDTTNAYIFGQMLGDGCAAKGVAGPDPGQTNGPYIIQLYKDSGSNAS